MAAKHKVIVSQQRTTHRPSSAERRAAQIEMLSNKQSELKNEAAERRRLRALNDATAAAVPEPPSPAAAERTDAD